jgi:oligopeptide transport system substrate-binding protein
MAAALREKQSKKRNVLFQSAENILLDQLPIIPIYIYTRVYLKNPKLEGWFPNIEDYRTYKGVYLK